MRDPAKTLGDRVVWQKAHRFVPAVSESMAVLVEVSKPLDAYSQAILNSDS